MDIPAVFREDKELRDLYETLGSPPLSPNGEGSPLASLSTSPPSSMDPHTMLKESKRRHITLTPGQKQKLRRASLLQKTARGLERLEEMCPTLFPHGFTPEQELGVHFHSGKKALLGKEIKLVATLQEPEVKWDPEPGCYYTLICVDPDYPSRERNIESEQRMWVVANILETDVFHGEVLQEYEPATPAIGTGLHNIVMLLYKQDNGKGDYRTFEGHRTRWSSAKWAQKNKMTLVAANYYQCQDKT